MIVCVYVTGLCASLRFRLCFGRLVIGSRSYTYMCHIHKFAHTILFTYTHTHAQLASPASSVSDRHCQSTVDASLFDVTFTYASVMSTSQLTRQYLRVAVAKEADLDVRRGLAMDLSYTCGRF